MSSSNENNDAGQDTDNNTSTTNIFGSSTKSSISSLFGTSTDGNQTDQTQQQSELNQPSATTNAPASSSTSLKFVHSDNSGEGAYDLFGTMNTTKTTVFGSKDSETVKDSPTSGDTNTASSTSPANAVDNEKSFGSGHQNGKEESSKPFGVFGVSTFDSAKTSNLFADSHFTRASDVMMPSQHKEPPVLHTHIEKPKEVQHLDLSKLTESDFVEGYDSNLYSVEDRDVEKLNKQKEQLYSENKLSTEDSDLDKKKEAESSTLFTTPDPIKTTTELFGQPDRSLKTFETFGSGDKVAPSLFGTSEPKTVSLGSVTAPTFNLVETDQTHKVTESSLSSKSDSFTTSLTEQGDSKTSLFGSSKSNLFGDTTKPSLFGTDDNKLLAPASDTSLFGSTDKKSTNLFGSTTTSNLFGTTGQSSTSTSLFGTSDTSKTGGLFGSTTSGGLFGTQDKSSDTTKTGTTDLFGASNKTDNLFGTTTTGGLFGTTEPSKTGGLFGSTTPATTNLFGTTDSSTTTNLFSTSDKATTSSTNLFATSQPSTTGGLFGSTDTTSKTGGLFGTNDSTSKTGGLFGTTKPATTGLFGTEDKPATATTTGGLFGTTETTTSAPLFGSTDTAGSSAKDLFGKSDKPATGGLFGTTDTTSSLLGQKDTGKTQAFGTDSTKTGDILGQSDPLKLKETGPKVTFSMPSTDTTEPTKTTTLGTTQTSYAGAQDLTKLDVDFSVTEQHTIAELLDSWEKRVAKKVESFNLFSDKVSTIDRQIVQQCNNINSLLTMHKELLEKHKKMEASIKTMEEEQKMTLSVLDNMEKVLKGKLESLNNRSNGYNMVQAITRNLQELSDQLSTTTKVAEETAEACQPEPLYTIAKVLSFHQVSLIDLEKQCDEIDRRIKALNPSLTL
ncbi:Spm1 (nucleoporin) protein [Theileria annulata]|uniref:Spm1 (Nucleoporin) protein n=1 Tax=Theileria annulata TaxID=5874 RepID=Q4UE62_THEAN|nr:Spm1 (nucleoporin) protein [Theileria annulata]CAI74627.1 Spm1 (nucleoporin) protein [Theileria annulata]|eukprot:XP_952359.1 Spm1 (nucleoporin) protein [Theileria annulata]